MERKSSKRKIKGISRECGTICSLKIHVTNFSKVCRIWIFFLSSLFFFFLKHPAYVNVTTKISQEQVSRNPVGVYLSARMSHLARARSGQDTLLMLCRCLQTWSDLDTGSINRFP